MVLLFAVELIWENRGVWEIGGSATADGSFVKFLQRYGEFPRAVSEFFRRQILHFV